MCHHRACAGAAGLASSLSPLLLSLLFFALSLSLDHTLVLVYKSIALVQVLQACLAGRQQPMRLMQAGMAFAVWTFQHASAEAIQPHAPAMLEKLLGLLDRELRCLQPSCLLESASTLLSAKLWGYCLCVVVWAQA